MPCNRKSVVTDLIRIVKHGATIHVYIKIFISFLITWIGIEDARTPAYKLLTSLHVKMDLRSQQVS